MEMEYNIEDLEKKLMELEISERMTGRTTRLADSYIQDLFKNIGECVEIHDHYSHLDTDMELANIIRNRVMHEHQIDLDTFFSDTEDGVIVLRIPEEYNEIYKKNKYGL